ncbi:hypothetical protein A2U01_0114126, partial [Trifolium medium]|nr:hypothetical protein [Trifolium medium]
MRRPEYAGVVTVVVGIRP